ncbi:hypothetical protein [Methanococcus sp. CF]
MKKYIILTRTIYNIGGAEIYLRNKKKFLEEKGYTVEICSYFDRGTLYIREFGEYQKNIIKELRLSPFVINKNRRNNIISKITTDIGECDEVIIESLNPNVAMWGELIAQKINSKHIIYLVDEYFRKLSPSQTLFFQFKHKRRELAGIHKKSLELLFGTSIAEEEQYVLNAACGNVVDEFENELIDGIDKYEINIGCISRLDKEYIPYVFDELVKFAKQYSNKNIQFIVVGDTVNKNNEYIKEDLKKKVAGINNLNVIMTGYLYPIPKRLFKIIDVAIGSAGCARITASENVLTIALDVSRCKPVGILGYNTENTIYCQENYKKDLSEILEDIVISNIIKKEDLGLPEKFKLSNFMDKYEEHFKFVFSSECKMDFFVFENYRLGNLEQIQKLIVTVFGINGYDQILSVYLKNLKKFFKI